MERNYFKNLSTYWSANFFALIGFVDFILALYWNIMRLKTNNPCIDFSDFMLVKLSIFLILFPFSIPIISILKSIDIKKNALKIILEVIFSVLLVYPAAIFINSFSSPRWYYSLLSLIIILLLITQLLPYILIPVIIYLDIKKRHVVPNKKLTENRYYKIFVNIFFYVFIVFYIFWF